MLRELLSWLAWVDQWAARTGEADTSAEIDEMHERREFVCPDCPLTR